MFSSENAGVCLKVGPGCLGEGQVTGPTTTFPDKRYVVECDNQRFLVSVVVARQPSGSKFNVPLGLDFRIRGPPCQERGGEKSGDGRTLRPQR